MSGIPDRYEPEWDAGADAWFLRVVTGQFLPQDQDARPGAWGDPDDPALLDMVGRTLLARRTAFVRWIDAPWYDPDVGWQGRWVIEPQAIRDALSDIVYECKLQLAAMRDAERIPDLDAWLTALARGELSEGPEEPHAEDLLDTAASEALWKANCRRYWNWPRVCRACGREFKLDRENAVRCLDCRKGPQRPTSRKGGRR